MAYAVEITLGTGNKVSLNYQSEEVNVSITYKLEREDTDVLEVVKAKTPELSEAHRLAWERVREAKIPRKPAPVAKFTQDIGLGESIVVQSTSAEPTSVLSGEELDAVDEPKTDESETDESETETEDTFQNDDLLSEEQQEDQAPITPAQVQVILALGRALELDEKTLAARLSIHANESVLECLTHAQAAALIIAMSRERREHLDREHSGSS